MEPSIENIPLKRKPRAVSTFLKRPMNFLMNLKILHASDGHRMGSDSQLPTSNYFQRQSYQNISNTVTTHHLYANQTCIIFIRFEKQTHKAIFIMNVLIEITSIFFIIFKKCHVLNKKKTRKKKRKNDESEDEDDGQENDTVPLRQRRIKQKTYEQQQSLNVVSQDHVSINLIKQDHDELIKSQKNTTRNLFSETFYHPEQQQNQHESIQLKSTSHPDFKDEQPIHNNIGSERNFLSIFDDDKLSINDQIIDRIPRFNTKELFYPSTNNLFPFVSSFQPNTFSIFY